MQRPVVHSDPEIQGGVPVFVGTRVPVKNLFDYLEARDSLADFLKSFPTVSREQAVAAIKMEEWDRILAGEMCCAPRLFWSVNDAPPE